MRLLERDASLAALAEYAEQARRGDGRLVLVAGEAGAGKSALVEEFERGPAAARWAWGACDGLSTPRPLGPLFDVAADLGGELLDLVRSGADRGRLFDALLRQLARSDELTAVVLEDVHWADHATLDLLRFLSRRVRGVPALLLVTYRDDQLGATDPLRQALGELAGHRSTRRLGLAPLSADAVGVLAGGSGLEPRELHRLTGGNPFYVTEVLRAGAGQVPPSARDAVLARAAGVSPAARATLDVAALLGNRLDLAVLADVVACPAEALDELLGSGLLAEDGPTLRFRHEIARLAVERHVPAHRRAALHARILTALERTGRADAARLAFHAEAAGSGPDVLRHAPAAARHAAEFGAHREAAAQYERALRFAAGAPPADVAELLTGFAWHSSLLDRWEAAAEATERALTLWRELADREREGEATRRLALAKCSLCQAAEGAALAEAAVRLLEESGPTVGLARAYGTLATFRMTKGESADAIRWARRAQELADRLDAFDVLADALNTEGCALIGRDPDWYRRLERALRIALDHDIRPQVGRAYANLFGGLVDERRFDEAEPYFTAGTAYCDEHDLGTYGRFMLASRTTMLQHRGDWEGTLALSERLITSADTSPLNQICPAIRVGTIHARRGGPDAWRYLDDAMTAADRTEEPQYVVPCRLIRAEMHWLAGDLAAARAEAESAAVTAVGADHWLRGETAVWLRRTGSPRTLPGEVAEPYRYELAGDWRRAVELWRARGCRFDAAMALADVPEEAALREALAAFDAMGAVANARAVRRTMRRLGFRSVPAGPRRTTREHPLGLTRRERQVLDLIAAGRSNAQIAERLVISPKTVDHHVSAVLAKLGVPSRGAASAEATRLGLV